MKKLPYFGERPAALALAVCALCSCGSGEHATILRRGETLANPVTAEPSATTTVRSSKPRRTWKDEALMKCKGERRVHIHLATQRGELLVNGQVAMDFPVSTGKQDSTPEGTYHILEKDLHHRSNLYHVSMPYFMRLTYDGIGLHIGDVYPVPVSHGCIRMTREACVPLYHLLPVGTVVVISRG